MFVDIVLVFKIYFISNNSIDIVRLAMFAIRCRIKKSIYKSCPGGIASVLRPPLQNYVLCPTSPNPRLSPRLNPNYL